MPTEHRPRFRIYRIDRPPMTDDEAPDNHYRAFWKIDDTMYRVQVWSKDAGDPECEKTQPPGARSLDGQGWMTLKPVEARSH